MFKRLATAIVSAVPLLLAPAAHAAVFAFDFDSVIDLSGAGGDPAAPFEVDFKIDLSQPDDAPEADIFVIKNAAGSAVVGGETIDFSNGTLQVFNDIDPFEDGMIVDVMQFIADVDFDAVLSGGIGGSDARRVSFVVTFAQEALSTAMVPTDAATFALAQLAFNNVLLESGLEPFTISADFSLDAAPVPLPAVGLALPLAALWLGRRRAA